MIGSRLFHTHPPVTSALELYWRRVMLSESMAMAPWQQGIPWCEVWDDCQASIYPKDWDWSLSISIYYQIFVGCVCAFLSPSWLPSHWQTTFKAYGFLLCFAYIGPLCITFMTGGMETNTWEIYGQIRLLVLLHMPIELNVKPKTDNHTRRLGDEFPACIWSSRGPSGPLEHMVVPSPKCKIMQNIRNMLKQVEASLHANRSIAKWLVL